MPVFHEVGTLARSRRLERSPKIERIEPGGAVNYC